MARRPVKGIGRVRKLLRRLPDAVAGEIVVELNVTGRQMNQAVLAKAPRKSGALRAGISYKVLPKSLRLQVGLLGTRKGQSKLFYGRIQDLGRKAQVVSVQRFKAGVKREYDRAGRKSGGGLTRRYLMKVRAMAPKRFVTGRYPDLRRALRDNLRGTFARSLQSISGAGDE